MTPDTGDATRVYDGMEAGLARLSKQPRKGLALWSRLAPHYRPTPVPRPTVLQWGELAHEIAHSTILGLHAPWEGLAINAALMALPAAERLEHEVRAAVAADRVVRRVLGPRCFVISASALVTGTTAALSVTVMERDYGGDVARAGEFEARAAAGEFTREFSRPQPEMLKRVRGILRRHPPARDARDTLRAIERATGRRVR